MAHRSRHRGLIEGRITCAEAIVYTDGVPTGKATIEVEFSAAS